MNPKPTYNIGESVFVRYGREFRCGTIKEYSEGYYEVKIDEGYMYLPEEDIARTFEELTEK